MIKSAPMTSLLQVVLVLMVTSVAMFFAVKNDSSEIIFGLTNLCFGYYFGARRDYPIMPKKSKSPMD